MNELYPIIRRKRRPLVVADAPATVVGNVEPASVGATKTVPEHGTSGGTPEARYAEKEEAE